MNEYYRVTNKEEQLDIVKKLLQLDNTEDIDFLMLWSENDLNTLITCIKIRLKKSVFVCPGGPYTA